MKLHEALQCRCEQLLESKDGITEDQIAKKTKTGEEANELYLDTLHQADELKETLDAQSVQREYPTLMEILDPSVGEFEKDSNRVQRKLSTFVSLTASHEDPEIIEIRGIFIKLESDVATRLNESRLLRKKTKATVNAPVIESPRPSRSSTLRLELPDFSSHPLDWHHFFQLFTSALDRAGDEFSDREKTCFLIKAMKSSEAEQIVKSYAAAEDDYFKALKALIQRFGSTKKVFSHLVHKMTTKETINFSQEGFACYQDKYLLPLQSMQELGCVNISQFAASLALENFDHHLRNVLTKHYKTMSEVHSLADLTAFLEPLENNIQALTLDDRCFAHSSSSRRTPSAPSKATSSVCVLCKEQHRLFKCPVFMGYDQARRHEYVKDKKGCFNCLGFNHTTAECASTFTCRECKGKHHTLLHRVPTTTTAPASAPNLMVTNQLSKSPPTDQQEVPPQVSFLHTAMAKAVHQDRETLVRAALDTGASSSLITEKLASRLHLKRHPRRLAITGACGGSQQALRRADTAVNV